MKAKAKSKKGGYTVDVIADASIEKGDLFFVTGRRKVDNFSGLVELTLQHIGSVSEVTTDWKDGGSVLLTVVPT